MEYFQLRKNLRQVVRILRGPYEGYDVTRLQIWYADRDGNEYKPGRAVAFSSEMIPGVIEGLLLMAGKDPEVIVTRSSPSDGLVEVVHRILSSHGLPLHWEVLSKILEKESPEIEVSKWGVYNCLLGNPDRFDQVEDDVFCAKGGDGRR